MQLHGLPSISFSPSFFFFNDTATTEIYTLSLHDALPISMNRPWALLPSVPAVQLSSWPASLQARDRKSTRLNSSHTVISYAVFFLKKKHLNDFLVVMMPAFTAQPLLSTSIVKSATRFH